MALALVLICTGACKKKANKDNSSDTSEDTEITFSEESKSSEDGNFEKIKDCDDFIDQYEAWSEDYIAFMTKFKENPNEAIRSPEYAEMAQKAASWSQQWLKISVNCASNPSYDKRMQKIGDKVSEELDKLDM